MNNQISNEERGVQILIKETLEAPGMVLENSEEFGLVFRGVLAALREIDDSDNADFLLTSDEDAYNEYEHAVRQEPHSVYKNTFNHVSKL